MIDTDPLRHAADTLYADRHQGRQQAQPVLDIALAVDRFQADALTLLRSCENELDDETPLAGAVSDFLNRNL